MAKVTLKGNEVNTIGQLPAVGQPAPDFKLVNSDLKDVSLADYKGKKVILNVFPSLDTSTCATSVRKFNEQASSLDNTVVLCISNDLPFAQNRFCGAEGIKNVQTLSGFRNTEFGKAYGVEIVDSVLKGLDARAVVVIDEQGVVKYTELVPEIVDEPNYEKALAAL